MALREYVGGAKRTTIVGDITAASTSITLTSGTGYPTGGTGPFILCLGMGQASEEKILVTSRSGNTLTVGTRGYDDTAASAHSSGTTVDHVLGAIDIREANAHVNDTTTDVHPQYLTAAEGNAAYAVKAVSGRNLLINGGFRVNQRGYASAASLASGAYGFDRWKATTAATTLTYTTAVQGQPVTINSGGSIAQVIERANVPAGSYVLSWSGTATGRVYNSGGAAPAYAASPVLVSLDGTADVVVEFTASGGTKTLDLVQLEAGSSPTPFERVTLAEEVTKCQRYYEKSFVLNITPFDNAGYSAGFSDAGIGFCESTTSIKGVIPFKVEKRAAPTMTVYYAQGAGGAAAGTWSAYDGTDRFALTTTLTAVTTRFQVALTGTGFTLGRGILLIGNWTASAEL